MKTNDHIIHNRAGQEMVVHVYPADNAKAPLALIAHGISGSVESPVAQRLSAVFRRMGHRVIVPDMRNNINDSGGSIDDFTFEQHASDFADAAEWVRTTWANRPTVIAGYSIGAYAAVRLAADAPLEYQKLVLVAPVVSGDFYLQVLEKNLPQGWAEWKRSGIATFGNDRNMLFEMKFPDNASWRQASALSDAHKISMPTVVINADKDFLVPPEHMAALRHHLPRATMSTAQGADHMFRDMAGKSHPGLEQALRSFLKDHGMQAYRNLRSARTFGIG